MILTLDLLPQPPDCASDGDSTGGVHGVSTTSLDLATILAPPDTNCLSLHSVLHQNQTSQLNQHFQSNFNQTGLRLSITKK